MTNDLDETQRLDEAQQKAARIAARAEIRDVRLLATSAHLGRQPEPASQLSYELKVEPSVQHEDEDNFFVVQVDYSLIIDQEDDGSDGDDSDSTPVATIEFTHAGLFQLEMRPGDEPTSTPELEAYAQSTGYFALYPYSREYIYNITGRLGLPPLTVGVLRLNAPPSRSD